MNIHVPQNFGGFMELSTFISVTEHIVSAQHNAPIIGLVQDSLLGWYLLTKNTTFIPRHILFDCITELLERNIVIDLKELALRIKKFYPECILCTDPPRFSDSLPGRVLSALILPNDFFYEKIIGEQDEKVIIKNGILVRESMRLCKKTLGGKAGSIVHFIFNEYSPECAANFLSHAQFIIHIWFPTVGFSVGIGDCMIYTTKKVEEALQKTKLECEKKIQIGGDHLEKEINASLNSMINIGDSLTKEGIVGGEDNSIVVMQKSGAKGSNINCTQIIVLVGQQNVGGKRIPLSLSRRQRTNPYFALNDEGPEARGFIDKSFLKGLTPQQTFFHAMGGREGIIDTAVKTARTGYMQRRIVKKIEDYKVSYDGTVRSNDGTILQFLYGYDGYNGAKIFNIKGFLFFIDPKRLAHKLNIKYHNEKPIPLSEKAIDIICKALSISKFKTECVREANNVMRSKLASLLKDVAICPSGCEEFGKNIYTKFHRSLAEPGEMVGIIAALSIGEPTTQGTLSTFHFSGLGDKDVTLGVPRMEECLNSTKKPKTPSCLIYINSNEFKTLEDNLKKAQTKEMRIELKKNCLEYLQGLKNKLQYCDVKYFLKSSPKIKFVEDDQPGFSPVSLYKPKPYKPEWWVDICKPSPVMKNEWVIELEFDIVKLHGMKVTVQTIADIIQNQDIDKPFGKFGCVVSPNAVGRIDVYIDFDEIEIPDLLSNREHDAKKQKNKKETPDDLEDDTEIPEDLEDDTEDYDLEEPNRYDLHLITEDNFKYFYTRDIVCKKILEMAICGVENINKIFPKEVGAGDDRHWVIDTQGCNFRKILNVDCVDYVNTTCDDFWQVYFTLGIEAARQTLLVEYTKSLSFDGAYIDPRHISLLVDSMTVTGTITSVSRTGINRNTGPLKKCAFEQTVDNFCIAAANTEKELVNSVSSRIIMGSLANIGTGYFGIKPNMSKFEKKENKMDTSYSKCMLDIVKEAY